MFFFQATTSHTLAKKRSYITRNYRSNTRNYRSNVCLQLELRAAAENLCTPGRPTPWQTSAPAPTPLATLERVGAAGYSSTTVQLNCAKCSKVRNSHGGWMEIPPLAPPPPPFIIQPQPPNGRLLTL